MKSKLFILSAISLFTATLAQAQICQPIKEHCQKISSCTPAERQDFSAALANWRGSYNRNGTQYDLYLDVTRKGGKMVSYMSIPQLGLKNIPCEPIFCCSKEIRFQPAADETIALTISEVKPGALKGRLFIGEEPFTTQYSLALNIYKKL